MGITIDDLTYSMESLEENRIRIVISLNEEVELGTLYFEKAKRSFINKPVTMNGWGVVDANIQGLYIHGGENITPKQMVGYCQELIRKSGQ